MESKEKLIDPSSGSTCCIAGVALIAVSFGMIALSATVSPFFAFLVVIFFFTGCYFLCGVASVEPNEARILMLFGEYKGTIKSNGLFWVNPFYEKQAINLKAQNL
jgi:regulator of protease activity HflC (stomatin/prohibitin superfamily)